MNRRLLAVVLAGACLAASTVRAQVGREATPTRMTFKDAVARIKEYRKDIEVKAGGDVPGKAHRPLD